jgi:prefoldin subunit 5
MASAESPSKPAAPRKRAATTRKPASTASSSATPKRQSQTTTVKRNATVASNARARAAKATVTEAKSGAKLVGTYAEKAVLVPVGAALTASDKVVELVGEIIDTYSTRKKTEAQLKRFERRGVTARTRIEKEARKARTRAEREVTRRRKTVEKRVTGLEKRADEATKVVTDRVEDVSSGLHTVASKVQETVKSIA